MDTKGWKYYNHAVIPTTPPHIEPNTVSIYDGTIWKMKGSPLLARWTTEFDCGVKTNWWYVIKDVPFDISELKAKRRYEINKGKKNFDVREINALNYLEDLFNVTEAAYSGWDAKYRPTVERETFYKNVKSWNWYRVIGIFSVDNDNLCGYALLSKQDRCIEFNVLRVDPNYEKLGANAAAVAKILEEHETFFLNGGYISDGARSINHETAFQDYLEKYFGFRKAYCKLHIKYNPKINWLLRMLYPMRCILKKFDNNRKIHLVNALFKMQEMTHER